MKVRIFFAGDVMGKPGRRALQLGLAELRQQVGLDAVVVNGENAAGGAGITREILHEFLSWGVDAVTAGNHVWDQRETVSYIESEARLLRPENAPPGTPGRGALRIEKEGWSLGVLNLMGRLFMHPIYDCPFRAADAALQGALADCSVILVDLHAEATSEKYALAWHLDGRVSLAVGSHTHVPTADERIFPGGMAYQSDAGMCGCYESIIGVDREIAKRRFIDAMPAKAPVAEGVASLCGLLVEVDTSSGKALRVERIRRDYPAV
ncbi:TIGR00282 family metallophosphoesterase [Candidatus Igneacidithiobacillus taiwanensis]|uniref:TIGR00282 family metallophosphoesterase n=1 Tax=Candidatus Igneacidithiobacillus taiwanensis TaxID=1945924 RepID=UPI0028996204|nr:TIGR00282 family metallophosphoesterase [Candidatus Igneacidithiobacillus taiwanensis]MCE5360765.1 YmdB family metallophosphoesterase [Acidithiobacillus sp.]